MKPVWRWVGIVVGGFAVVMVIAAGSVWAISNARMNRTYPAEVGAVTLPPADSAMRERGRHLVDADMLCRDCHGPDLAGQYLIDVPVFARLYAPNITPGGVTAEYTDADWVRILRYGVLRDGRSAAVMPAESYTYLSDADLAATVGYLRSVPAVQTDPVRQFHPGPVGRMLLAKGDLMPIFVAARVAEDTSPEPTVTVEDTSAAYGYYLAQISGCMGCHGPNLAGGPIAGGDPEAPVAANITPGGIASWDFATFERAMRHGVGPADRLIDSSMPRRPLMNDTEMRALWNYLRTIPAQEFGAR